MSTQTWIIVLVAAFALWRVSLLLAPYKKCRYCAGSGARGGLLGGFRKCGECSGTGLVKRIGAGGD